ncbi:MAG: GNAT family N-acetyltransferase [Actinobacteria bacterium]|nr:GNAT family N-acetyltransferase [Actinomycetota bacterium]
MLTLRRLSPDDCDWRAMDALPDRVVYQTREWLSFLAATQRGEPFVAELLDERRRRVGYFTGLIISKYGVRILGSPFPGWSSGPMGFNLHPGANRHSALRAVLAHAFGPLRCLHVELLDRGLELQDVAQLGLRHDTMRTYAVDLRPDEDEIYASVTSPCRRAIKKSRRFGVTVEEAHGEDFADEFHPQLVDVFAKQSLTPRLDADRVRVMIRELEPTGRLLLLRARSAEGEGIATGIFLGMNGVAYAWGAASLRAHQAVRPNEAITWHAIRHWKARGAQVLDLGGGTEEGFTQYKRKFRPDEHVMPHVRESRFAAIAAARSAAELLARRQPPRLALGRRTAPSSDAAAPSAAQGSWRASG